MVEGVGEFQDYICFIIYTIGNKFVEQSKQSKYIFFVLIFALKNFLFEGALFEVGPKI